jgi:hypothetical protein
MTPHATAMIGSVCVDISARTTGVGPRRLTALLAISTNRRSRPGPVRMRSRGVISLGILPRRKRTTTFVMVSAARYTRH